MKKLVIAGLGIIAIGIAFLVSAGLIYNERNRIVSEQDSLPCNTPSVCPHAVGSIPAVPLAPDDKMETGIALVLAGTSLATTAYWFGRFNSFLHYLSKPRRLLIAGIIVISVHVSVLVLAPYIRYCVNGYEFVETPCSSLDGLVEILYHLMPVMWFNTVWIGPAMITMAVVRGWRPAIHGKMH